MSNTKSPFTEMVKGSSSAVPLPTGGYVQPTATNKLPSQTPTPRSDVPYMQYTQNGVLVSR